MKKKGRPLKKNYDAKMQFEKLLETVDYVYDITGEINATAAELDMSTVKVKKLLITSGKLEYDETKQIQRLMAYGKNISEIQDEIGLKKSSINSYLPYTKVPYKDSEISANADRCDLYRKRKVAVEALGSCGNTHNFNALWEVIELFEGYSFSTINGLKFEYTVSDGKLIINREEKCITKAVVETAYNNVAMNRNEDRPPVYDSPEDLGDLFGINYIYSMFYRFGLIDL